MRSIFQGVVDILAQAFEVTPVIGVFGRAGETVLYRHRCVNAANFDDMMVLVVKENQLTTLGHTVNLFMARQS
jgi:hypothetical protein